MSKFPEYNDSYESSVQYLDEFNKYVNRIYRTKYNIILKFLNKWTDGIIQLWKLTDFKHVSQFHLPKDRHSKEILENYADDVCSKLEIDYKFDEKKVKQHYNQLKQNRKKTGSSQVSGGKTILNAAHDDKYIFRSEMINVLRTLLKKINYTLCSRTTEKCVIWWIQKGEFYDTIKKNTDDIYSDKTLSTYDKMADQDKSMINYINKRFKNGRRIKRVESDESFGDSYSDSES